MNWFLYDGDLRRPKYFLCSYISKNLTNVNNLFLSQICLYFSIVLTLEKTKEFQVKELSFPISKILQVSKTISFNHYLFSFTLFFLKIVHYLFLNQFIFKISLMLLYFSYKKVGFFIDSVTALPQGFHRNYKKQFLYHQLSKTK